MNWYGHGHVMIKVIRGSDGEEFDAASYPVGKTMTIRGTRTPESYDVYRVAAAEDGTRYWELVDSSFKTGRFNPGR